MKISDFWKQTYSNTLGTIVGIALTFGTTAWLQSKEQEKMEHTVALMVIHNIDDYCDNLESEVDRLSKIDSINGIIFDDIPHNLKNIPDSLLEQFAKNLLARQFYIHDNTAYNIFSNNIDIWRDVKDSYFIENAGKCFEGMRLMDILFDEKLVLENKIFDYYKGHVVIRANNIKETLRQHVCRITKVSSVKAYIEKIHEYYLPAAKGLLKELKEHNDQNKKVMSITQEELDMLDHQHDDIKEKYEKENSSKKEKNSKK